MNQKPNMIEQKEFLRIAHWHNRGNQRKSWWHQDQPLVHLSKESARACGVWGLGKDADGNRVRMNLPANINISGGYIPQLDGDNKPRKRLFFFRGALVKRAA